MIITRTPLRISLVGGGSDLREYYKKNGGAVLSTSINKYVYVMINRWFDEHFRVIYSEPEFAEKVEEIKHGIVREALKMTAFGNKVSITYAGDIPIGGAGSGLGGSSALAVGTLHALLCLQKKIPKKEGLAHGACVLEIEKLGHPMGKQDQYASAYGGLNEIQFHEDESVTVRPVNISSETKETLQKNLLLFYTGLGSDSKTILGKQMKNTEAKRSALDAMVGFVGIAKKALEDGNVDAIGNLLHENWKLKQGLVQGITNPLIDNMYEKARKAGALGGKVLGSGGGGFLLLYVKKENQERVRRELIDFKEAPFRFEDGGSAVIYDDNGNGA